MKLYDRLPKCMGGLLFYPFLPIWHGIRITFLSGFYPIIFRETRIKSNSDPLIYRQNRTKQLSLTVTRILNFSENCRFLSVKIGFDINKAYYAYSDTDIDFIF